MRRMGMIVPLSSKESKILAELDTFQNIQKNTIN